MELVADEGVDKPIVDRLRSKGYTVWYVAEMEPGIGDDAVLGLANDEGAIVLVSDKDFGELVYRQHRESGGVVLLLLAGLSVSSKAAVVSQVLRERGTELWGAFTVIRPGHVRIRKQRR
jgi:predicted nuclease of predicted toxin-antitoxin system